MDERLNWAVVTPGGLGSVNIVDLGRLPGTGANTADLGRPAAVIAALSASTTIRGVGINQQTHTALLADPTGPSNSIAGPALSAFSLMDQTIGSVPFTQNNLAFNQLGLTASGVNSLSNVGIAVNSAGNNGYVVDMQNNTVLQTFGGLNGPTSVAVDEATNKAYVLNQGNSTVSIVSLGNTFNPLQVTSSNPDFTFVEPTPTPVDMTVTGFGFVAGSTVYLDDAPLATNFVSARELTAIVPAANVSAARRYVIYVKSGAAVSNLSDLTVIQPVTVGTNPVGVAIDSYLDQAVVTNSGSDSVSVINLLDGATITPQAPSFFSTGTQPVGVAVLPRLGLAVVSNYGSDNATILDERGVSGTFEVPQTVTLCAPCENPLGVAIDQDSGQAQVVNTETSDTLLNGEINSFAVNLGTTIASSQVIHQGANGSGYRSDLEPRGNSDRRTERRAADLRSRPLL